MTTQETSTLVRWLVILVLGVATLGMTLVSLRANYLFGYGFGQTAERAEVFGWANVAADLWKVSGLIVITSLWRANRVRFALGLLPVWLLCLLWGFAGAIGVYAQDRTAVVGGREAVAATYKDVERELQEIDDKLKIIATKRTVEQVDAAIAVVSARPVVVGERVRGTVGKLSSQCTKSDRLTAEACAEVASLREERAEAAQRATLETRKAHLRMQANKLRVDGGSLAADPVAELFAWLSRGQLSVRDIAFGFPLMFAFLIEVVSAFGPAGIVAYAEATRRDGHTQTRRAMARLGAVQRAKAVSSEHGRVVKWIAERTEPTAAQAAIGLEMLHADYEVWCLTHQVEALPMHEFGAEFDHVREVPQLADKIRKFANRYYGIRLLHGNVARLPTRVGR